MYTKEADQESPNNLLDNVLYYISRFVVKSILKTLKCTDSRSELLLDVQMVSKQYYIKSMLSSLVQAEWWPSAPFSSSTENGKSH